MPEAQPYYQLNPNQQRLRTNLERAVKHFGELAKKEEDEKRKQKGQKKGEGKWVEGTCSWEGKATVEGREYPEEMITGIGVYFLEKKTIENNPIENTSP